MNESEPATASPITSTIGRKDLTSLLPNLRRGGMRNFDRGPLLRSPEDTDDAIIVFRRVDVNKKPFRLIQFRDLDEVDPARVNAFQQVQRTATACFDQLRGDAPAWFGAVKSGQRLRPPVGLNRHDGVVFGAQ